MVKKTATPKKPAAPAYPFRLEWRTPEELADNPSNWRDHPEAQTAALDGVLTQLAGMPGAEPGSQWAGALAYNERTERLIDGHARKKVPPELMVGGKVPVLVGSWTEEQERFILATLDPLAAMAEANADALAELLRTSPTDDPAVQAMLDELAADAGIVGDDDPGGGEQPVQDDNYSEQYGVIVVCESEASQERIFGELNGHGYNCRVVVT